MAGTGLALAVVSIATLWVPRVGMYIGLGLALAAVGFGWLGYRDASAPGGKRLCGAAAITVGSVGFLLSGAKVVLTIAAVGALGDLLR